MIWFCRAPSSSSPVHSRNSRLSEVWLCKSLLNHGRLLNLQLGTVKPASFTIPQKVVCVDLLKSVFNIVAEIIGTYKRGNLVGPGDGAVVAVASWARVLLKSSFANRCSCKCPHVLSVPLFPVSERESPET